MFSFILAHAALISSTGGVVALGLLAGLLTALLRVIGPAVVLAHWRALLACLAAFVACLAVALLYVAWQHAIAQLATAQANYQTVLGQNRTLTASNANLLQQVDLQNKSIQLYADAARKAKDDAAAALAQAQSKQAADKATVASLRARIADPKTNTGSCDDEIVRLRGTL